MSELAGFVARGRDWHPQVMTDTVTVSRPTGAQVYNDVTQQYDVQLATAYSGAARIRIWRGIDVEAAETEINVQRYYLDLPLTGSVPDVKRRDTVTVTASLNPALVGRVLVLTDVESETTDTALRITCEYAQ